MGQTETGGGYRQTRLVTTDSEVQFAVFITPVRITGVFYFYKCLIWIIIAHCRNFELIFRATNCFNAQIMYSLLVKR